MGGDPGCLRVIPRVSRIQKTSQKLLPRRAELKVLT